MVDSVLNRQDSILDIKCVVENSEWEYRRRILEAIIASSLLVLVPVVGIFVWFYLVNPAWQSLTVMVGTALLYLLMLILHRLVRNGHSIVAGYMFVVASMLVVTVNGILVSNLFSILDLVYVVLVVLSVVAIGIRGSFIAAVLSIVFWCSGYVIIECDLVSQVDVGDAYTWAVLIITLSGYVLVCIVNYFTFYNLRRTLVKALYNLAAANRELQQATEVKTRFFASTSHELRTPLNSVLGFADLIRLEVYGPITQLQREGLERIKESGVILLDLVNDILELTRFIRRNVELAADVVDVRDLCNAVFCAMKVAAHKKGLVFTMTVAEDMAKTVIGDKKCIERIMCNLCDNAIKYTARGAVNVYVSRSFNAEVWQIKVCDTGIGIESKEIEHIFEEFYRVNLPETTKNPGSGLGLSIVHEMVQAMKGTTTVESEIGKGSIFIVTLPLRAA